MNPVRVAVVGVGHLGAIHARIYSELPSVKLVAVCDVVPERAQALANKYHCEAVADSHELLGKIDAVSIAVPTQHHFPIAKFFLSEGIPALVEKPITQTVQEADQLLRLSTQTGAILQVGHVERFNSALRTVQSWLENPRFIEVHRLAPFQPRGTEVGVVLDLMIHDIDILLGLVKSPIKRIEAIGVKVLTPFEDIANARITFVNGSVANLTASRISREAMRKFRIFQHDGYISIDFMAQSADIFRHDAGRLSLEDAKPLRPPESHITHEQLNIPKEEPLKTELAAFVESIQHERPHSVSGQAASVRGNLTTSSGLEAREALAVALRITRLIHKERSP